MHAVDYLVLIVYAVCMVALGVWVGRRITSFREYFVVAGRLTPPLLVCSLVSTYYGLDVLFGVSEVSFQEGVVAFFVYSRPYYVFLLIAGLFVARRLKQHDFLSLPDVSGKFYGNPTRYVTACASFVYALPVPSIMGLAVLLDVVFGIPFHWAVIAGAGVSLAYTAVGGLMADVITDTVQFVLMCVMLGLACHVGLQQVGGVEGLTAALSESYFEPLGTYPSGTLLVYILAAASALIDPGLYQRIFAASSYRSVVVAMLVSLVLWSAFDWTTTVLGMVAKVSGLPITEPKYALLELTLSVLPAGLAGLFAVGVIAAAMSTIDSYLLIAGGNLAYDIYRPLSKRTLNDREQMRLTRIAMVFSGLLTIVLALSFKSIVSAWVFMVTLLMSAALIPVLGGLYLPAPHSRTAGFLSSIMGLAAAAGFYVVVNVFGVYSEEWSTKVLSLSWLGEAVDVWQDHALLLSLPVAATGYLIGHIKDTWFSRRGEMRANKTVEGA